MFFDCFRLNFSHGAHEDKKKIIEYIRQLNKKEPYNIAILGDLQGPKLRVGEIENGEIVLIDAGCEFENYASDITRCFPANGKFSPEQKLIYNLVLKAQLAGIEKVKPGTSYPSIQEAVVKTLTEGLVELGLLSGKIDELIAQKAYQTFYMHNAGHWLGLDTHDVGNYKPNNEWRKLAPGMMLTVEPGIYISANTPGVDEKWWNIGIRIEDNVLVTEKGHEVITGGLLKTIDDIEKLMI